MPTVTPSNDEKDKRDHARLIKGGPANKGRLWDEEELRLQNNSALDALEKAHPDRHDYLVKKAIDFAYSRDVRYEHD